MQKKDTTLIDSAGLDGILNHLHSKGYTSKFEYSSFHTKLREKLFRGPVDPHSDRFWVEYNRLLVLRIALAENLQEASNAAEHG